MYDTISSHHASTWFPSIPSLTDLLLSFFFNDTATTEIYTLSLHDAFRSLRPRVLRRALHPVAELEHQVQFAPVGDETRPQPLDRKSTRLNSSHSQISYAVFCLKKKNKKTQYIILQRTYLN